MVNKEIIMLGTFLKKKKIEFLTFNNNKYVNTFKSPGKRSVNF